MCLAKAYVLSQAETVSINLIVFEMQLLVQFQIKVVPSFMMLLVEPISDL